MSTTSHKSRTRILSEEAMKVRVHTSREDRSRTLAGKDLMKKVHSEAQTLKSKKRSATVGVRKGAVDAKKLQPARKRLPFNP
jgi:hypothetical protein